MLFFLVFLLLLLFHLCWRASLDIFFITQFYLWSEIIESNQSEDPKYSIKIYGFFCNNFIFLLFGFFGGREICNEQHKKCIIIFMVCT